MELDAQIKDADLLMNALVVLSAVILMFFLHSVPSIHLDLGWIAVIGAMALLLLSGIHNIEELMMKVEWATLLFFAALFILMEALAELGLIDWIGTAVATMIKNFPDGSRNALSIIVILWVSAYVIGKTLSQRHCVVQSRPLMAVPRPPPWLRGSTAPPPSASPLGAVAQAVSCTCMLTPVRFHCTFQCDDVTHTHAHTHTHTHMMMIYRLSSSFIDNIPFTTAMIPVIKKIASDPELIDAGLTLRPLVWALAFGACLGGNGTLIGASANVVMAGLAEQEGISITFNGFFKVGFPIMLVSTFIAMIYLIICHVAFDWQ